MDYNEITTNFVQGLREDLLEKAAGADLTDDNNTWLDKVAEEFETLMLVTGMDKEAGLSEFAGAVGQSFGSGGSGVDAASKAIVTMGMGAATGLGALAVAKANRAMKTSTDRTRFERSLSQATERSELLRAADPDKLERFAISIYTFAPTVATDPNVLANVLTNAIHGESLDLQTIRAVTELEEKLQKNNPSLIQRALAL